MTIRTKLSANVIIVSLMIDAVSMASLFGIWFVRDRLSYLTKRSTPYQLRSDELQLAIHEASANLVKVSASRSSNDFNSARSEAEKSLHKVKSAEDALNDLDGKGSSGSFEKLRSVANELFLGTESRIRAEKDLHETSGIIDRKLREVMAGLKGLDAKVRSLQDHHSAAYSTASIEANNISSRIFKVA